MPDHPDGLLTYEEAAHEIGLTLGSLKQVIARGALHPVKVSRQRRKFLRREEIIRYRDGKVMHTPSQKSTFAARLSEPATESLPTSLSRQDITEALQEIIAEANKAWAANAEAYQASVEAYQASAVAIRDGLIRALQVYYTALTGTADWPQMSGDLYQPKESVQTGSASQGKANASVGEDFFPSNTSSSSSL